jgi:hypothetical protein
MVYCHDARESSRKELLQTCVEVSEETHAHGGQYSMYLVLYITTASSFPCGRSVSAGIAAVLWPTDRPNGAPGLVPRLVTSGC